MRSLTDMDELHVPKQGSCAWLISLRTRQRVHVMLNYERKVSLRSLEDAQSRLLAAELNYDLDKALLDGNFEEAGRISEELRKVRPATIYKKSS